MERGTGLPRGAARCCRRGGAEGGGARRAAPPAHIPSYCVRMKGGGAHLNAYAVAAPGGVLRAPGEDRIASLDGVVPEGLAVVHGRDLHVLGVAQADLVR
eukprot:CAMPEP_0179302912 /NCGR_PEP_ID=MMETSP0797-20121207/48310_1 /TAXON_ID=47934 /ORGANISM="Dinophysis acuminata, Strain DAEP01" /LENGTH=99 /DNA_ID=CAMNT_0021012459 /DNA_START=39 /DNA_END=333 /DNA_ORIENTATION=+